jgi:hypothetical protein
VAGLPGAEVLEGLGQPITEAVPPSTPPSTPPSVLPAAPVERAPDDRDVGWGDRPPEDDDRRYLENRPPHWGSD